ncbi:MAG TPA: FKBP-type peptidyl-prolyl cis-trans isomerase [Bacteroides sp.]|nr:FKBP-type peptidyl-prolyl cis-trans isomerase [Bacteroides sp.]
MKGKFVIALLPVVLIYASSCQKKIGNVSLETKHDSVAYMIGHNIGINLGQSPMTDINMEAISKGIQDAIDGEELFMDQYAANAYIGEYMQNLEATAFDGNLEEGREFLDENKKRVGIVTTETDLQYEILVEGNGPKPADTDNVTVHYHGTLIDGTVFDSSVDRGEPAQFGVNQVIAGWTEVLKLMPVGSKWKIYIPSEIAYGDSPRPGGPIEPNMALIFEIELISIN